MNKHRTYEEVLNAAKCYQTRMQFKNNDKANYSYAVSHGWLNDVCSHMNPVGDMFKRCIYAYEFPNNVCYIGLTFDIEKRHKEHSTTDKSAVYRYCLENKIQIPKPIKLTDYVNKDEASKLEGEFLEKYKERGWNMINKAKTGGLGGHRNSFTNKKIDVALCKNIAMECDNQTQFMEKYRSLYLFSKRRGWLEYIFSHFDKEEIRNKGHKKTGEKQKGKIQDPLIYRNAAIKANLNKIVEQYDLDGNFIKEYISQEEAARQIGKPICHSNIGKCCKGKLKTCCGYKWKYKK